MWTKTKTKFVSALMENQDFVKHVFKLETKTTNCPYEKAWHITHVCLHRFVYLLKIAWSKIKSFSTNLRAEKKTVVFFKNKYGHLRDLAIQNWNMAPKNIKQYHKCNRNLFLYYFFLFFCKHCNEKLLHKKEHDFDENKHCTLIFL